MKSNIICLSKTAFAIFGILVLSFGANQVQAQYSGYYGEGFYGSGDTEFNFFTDISDFNGDSDFFGITVGRVFNDNIAAEVSYVDFGNSQSVVSDPLIATLDAELDAQAIAFNLVGNYPINRHWNVFGKFGFNQWNLTAKVSNNSYVPTISLSGKDRGSGFNYGAGVQYRLTPRYSIKLEYQVYQLNPEIFSGDLVINGATIALRFNY